MAKRQEFPRGYDALICTIPVLTQKREKLSVHSFLPVPFPAWHYRSCFCQSSCHLVGPRTYQTTFLREEEESWFYKLKNIKTFTTVSMENFLRSMTKRGNDLRFSNVANGGCESTNSYRSSTSKQANENAYPNFPILLHRVRFCLLISLFRISRCDSPQHRKLCTYETPFQWHFPRVPTPLTKCRFRIRPCT